MATSHVFEAVFPLKPTCSVQRTPYPKRFLHQITAFSASAGTPETLSRLHAAVHMDRDKTREVRCCAEICGAATP